MSTPLAPLGSVNLQSPQLRHCDCGSARAYHECCQPWHDTASSTRSSAPSAEQLMRSRYSAYRQKLIAYIANTYHPSVRAQNSTAAIAEFAADAHFCHLSVTAISESLLLNDHSELSSALLPLPHAALPADSLGWAWVQFTVTFIMDDRLQQLHERSRFVKTANGWFYLDGVPQWQTLNVVGRNDICPCGSGKKRKKCS